MFPSPRVQPQFHVLRNPSTHPLEYPHLPGHHDLLNPEVFFHFLPPSTPY